MGSKELSSGSLAAHASSGDGSVEDAAPKDHLGVFLDAIADDEENPSGKRARERVLGAGRVIAERYQLGDRIARGGMATIWRATDTKLNRVVAIKFMGQAYTDDAEYRKRFEEEARAAAQLRTPHVVAIHDHGVAEGVPFIVMELLEGEDLHARMHRLKRLPLPFVAQVATEASKALKVAHAAGIVHRDLKPKNLFIANEDDREVVKLLDFGVAKHAGTAALMTATGVMLGSPFYMSPEQIRCERNLDGRTDLWSLATILYRALTGVKAFDGDMARVMFQITRERPKPPSELCSDLPPSLDAFFAKALATKRENRFASAVEFAEAFNEAAAVGASHAEIPTREPPPPRAWNSSATSGTRQALARPPAPPQRTRSGMRPLSPVPMRDGLGTEPLVPLDPSSEPPATSPGTADAAIWAAAIPLSSDRPLGPPSDHPTFAAPVGVLTNLVQAKTTHGTGLRFSAATHVESERRSNYPTPPCVDAPVVAGPHAIAPPPLSSPVAEPLLPPNLTAEQRSGFAVGAHFDENARWQAYVMPATRSSVPAKPDRPTAYILAAIFILAAAVGLTVGLVLVLR